MAESTAVVSSQSADVCVERLCRLAARPAYRVSQRGRVTDIVLADLDLDRGSSGKYDIKFSARCREATLNPGLGRAFLVIVGRLTPHNGGTEMRVEVSPGRPALQRDRVRQKVEYAVLIVALAVSIIAAIATGDGRLWSVTGAGVVAASLLLLWNRMVFAQAARAVTALLASTVSASLADADIRITLST